MAIAEAMGMSGWLNGLHGYVRLGGGWLDLVGFGWIRFDWV